MSVLAIDAGTTGVTAVVVSPQGDIVAKGYQEFAQHFPRPGWVEHAPEEIWQATLEATKAALKRVDAHAAPVEELARLLDLNDLYLTASTEEEKVPVTPELREELEEMARAGGHRDLHAWVGTENYEMRVADDLSWIDRRVLAIARGQDGDEGGAA